jgi:hypothetical protein
MSSYYVNASTSLILAEVSSIVYLSSLNAPGTLITIRDYTGQCKSNSTITISTTNNISFLDGETNYSITQPFGFLTVSPKTSSIWTLVNSFAFSDSLSASVDQITAKVQTVSSLFTNLISTSQLLTSSIGVGVEFPAYQIDVNGVINATDFYKNGLPYVTSGDIPVINTSSISINSESKIYDIQTLVGVSKEGKLYTSQNSGQSWTSITQSLPYQNTTTTTNLLYDASNNIWNAFGYWSGAYYPEIIQSIDLISWSSINVPQYNTITNITSNESFYYLYSSNPASYSNYKTPDLINYTAVSLTPFSQTITNSVKYINNIDLFLGLGKGANTTISDPPYPDGNKFSVQFSSDCESWNCVSSIGSGTASANIVEFYDMIYTGTRWIACGNIYDGLTTTKYPSIIYSDNISTNVGFTDATIDSNCIAVSLAANGSTIVALTYDSNVTSSPIFYSSDNGETWISTARSIFTSYINIDRPSVTWNGTNFIAGGPQEPSTLYSADGITWGYATGTSTLVVTTPGTVRRTLPNMTIGETYIYTNDPLTTTSTTNQFIFYSTLMKINNNLYLSNTGEVGFGTSTMRSILDISGTLTTTELDLVDSNTRLTATPGTVYVNGDPLITSTTLGNYTVPISTLSTLTITNTLNVLVPGVSGLITTSSIGVNCNAPSYEVDISGSLYALNMYSQSVSVPTIYATQIGVNCNSPTDTVDVNGAIRANTAWFDSLGVGIDIPSYTMEVAGSLNTSSLFINGSLFINTTNISRSSLVISTVSAYGPDGSNFFVPSTFFDKPVNTTLFNTSSIRYYKQTGTTSVYEPLTINSFVSMNNPNTSNIWVAVGRDTGFNTIKYSSNGTTWLNASVSTNTTLYEGWAVAYNGTQWLTCLNNSANTITSFYSSSDGINWTQNISTPTSIYPNKIVHDIIWNGKNWIAVGADSRVPTNSNYTISLSSNSSNWIPCSSGGFGGASGQGRGICFNGYRMVAVGTGSSSNESIKYSDDLGSNWTSVSSNGFSSGGLGIATNGYMFIACGGDANSNASIKYSYNGINWINIPTNGFSTGQGWGAAWNGYMWVSSGNDSGGNSLKYSYDGINWSNGTGGTTGIALRVAWNGSYWVAVTTDATSNARINYSFNGINWSNSSSGAFNQQGFGIGFSSNVFPDLQVENLSYFGKNLFNTVYSTNSIHLQTSSILINNTLRVNQPQLTVQSGSNPTVDIQGFTRIQTLFTQSTLGINNPNPAAVLDIQLPSTAGVFSNFPIIRGNVNATSELAISTFLASVNTWCAIMAVPQSNSANINFYYRGGSTGQSNYKVQLTGTSFFTGQHANISVDSRVKVSNLSSCVGLIVSSADQGYYSILPNGTIVEGQRAIYITEALPKIKLTDTDKDKGVWGVITNHMNDIYAADGKRELDYQSQFASPLQGRIRVNGLGEGAVWVTNINGNLANGDYICSSVIPGYGRKQDDDVVHNYTVAKATMSCTFNIEQHSYKCEEFEYNGQTYRRAYIGCSYHCS